MRNNDEKNKCNLEEERMEDGGSRILLSDSEAVDKALISNFLAE